MNALTRSKLPLHFPVEHAYVNRVAENDVTFSDGGVVEAQHLCAVLMHPGGMITGLAADGATMVKAFRTVYAIF